jgi:hypothetical protein
MKRVVVAAALVILGVSFNPAMGAKQQLAIWDFGQSSAYYTEVPTAENVTGTPTLLIDGGQKDNDGKNGVEYKDIAGVSHIAGQAGAWEDVKATGLDAEWIVTINTTGWQDIDVRFDYKAWDPTTTSFDLDYRLSDSAEWTEILDNQSITADSAFHSFSTGLPTAINNKSFVQFRFNDLDESGNDKFAFDNLEFAGNPVPEPASATMIALGAALFASRRKQR